MSGKTLLLTVLGLALAGCNTTSGGSHLARSGDLDTTGMITLEAAVAAASAAVPGGWAIEAELELEDEGEGEPPAYEVVFHIPGAAYVTDVEVDAYTGEILEIEDDTEDDEDEGEDDDATDEAD